MLSVLVFWANCPAVGTGADWILIFSMPMTGMPRWFPIFYNKLENRFRFGKAAASYHPQRGIRDDIQDTWKAGCMMIRFSSRLLRGFWRSEPPQRRHAFGRSGEYGQSRVCRGTENPPRRAWAASFLSALGQDFSGILNGCDYGQWNPEIDPHLPANYSPVIEGEKCCVKQHYWRKQDCSINWHHWSEWSVAWRAERVFIPDPGSAGNSWNGPAIGTARWWRAGNCGCLEKDQKSREVNFISNRATITVLPTWSSRVRLYLMPSLYEPCGLNQIYSLRYGTLPIVRKVEDWKIPWRLQKCKSPRQWFYVSGTDRRGFDPGHEESAATFQVIRKSSTKWFLMQWINGFSGKLSKVIPEALF